MTSLLVQERRQMARRRASFGKKDKAESDQVIYYHVSAYKRNNKSYLKAIPAEDPDTRAIVFTGAAKEAAILLVSEALKR